MRLHTYRSGKKLAGKKIIIRIDGNVPIKKGKAIDGPNGKIARAAVDLEWFRQRGAKLIVMTHLGRPKGKRVAAYSVKPIAGRISQLLGVKVEVCKDVVGPRAKKMIDKMNDGDILMVENVRFSPQEEKNDPAFAKKLAELGDVYINDAFAVCHRAHASVEAITKELPSYAGPLVVHEVSVLSSLLKNPKKPFVLVMGGLKITTKLPVLKKLLPLADKVLIGGALANVFHVAKKERIGKSVYEKDGVDMAKALLKNWRDKIVLPTDVVVVSRLSSQARMRTVTFEDMADKDMIVDIGRETVRAFQDELKKARTVVWNGPLGYCEVGKFCKGTQQIAKAISQCTGRAKTIAGGGDTIPVIESFNISQQLTLISTGGGAMLSFLSGEKLPGLEALRTKE